MLHIPRLRHEAMFSYSLVSTVRTRGARTYIKAKVATRDHDTTSFFPAVTSVLFSLLEKCKYLFLFLSVISAILAQK